jgi:biopolymer transport protein ExbD
MNLRLGGRLLILLILGMLLAWQRHRASHLTSGIIVHLPHRCTDSDSYDNRIIVVQLRSDDISFINSTTFPPKELPEKMARIMEFRAERVVYLIADRSMAYGDVIETISALKMATPYLNVVLLPDRPEEENIQIMCFSGIPESQ